MLICLKLKRRHLPRSAMGLAIDYALSLWPQLGVYLDDGRVEIDQKDLLTKTRENGWGRIQWVSVVK